MKKLVISLFILISSFIFYKTASFFNFLYSKASSFSEEKVIYIKPGSSFIQVTNHLLKNGLIKDRDYFMFLARMQDAFSKIKAGEFNFNTNMTPLEVMDILLKGKEIRYDFTIPEGYNMYQVADVLVDNNLLDNKQIFLKEAKDKVFLNSLKIPTNTVEGYLYPDTYSISKRMKARDIIKLMVETFNKNFEDEFLNRAKELKFTKHQIVTLASIIEKETGSARERTLISSVFHNRLKQGMKLQSDPTTIYGIWETFDGNLTRAHLRSYTPYNTYYIFGLPPSPIANPGKKSIIAALYPENSQYLYFVSRNDGTHYFSTNYQEHSRAVYKYQKLKKYRKR